MRRQDVITTGPCDFSPRACCPRPRSLPRRIFAWSLFAFAPLFAGTVSAVERFPAPEFRSGYQLPKTEVSPVQSAWYGYVDMAVLAGALGLAAYFIYNRRSRRAVFWLTVFSLLYFGFWRKGCICPIGSIQNVAYAAGSGSYALPLGVAVFFVLPLLTTLFFGRAFCAAVCPLGAIQDVVLWKPVNVPPWLEQGLGLFAYLYLGLAVLFASIGSDFVICRYDPFVGFFRLSAEASMLFLGGVLLLASMFIGRTYCRFICPYGVILRILSIFSKRTVSITPTDCVDCRLCEQSCPFGAIRFPTPQGNPRRSKDGKHQLALAIALLPVIVAGFAGVGWLARNALSRADFTVRQAERVWLEENKLVQGETNESKAFRDQGRTPAELYADARTIQRKYAIGAPILGAYMGLVVGIKLIALIVRRQRSGYTTDPGGCVACARCYVSCPVEREHKEERRRDLVVA